MFEHDCDLCGSPSYLPLTAAHAYFERNEWVEKPDLKAYIPGAWAEVPVVCQNCGFVFIRNRRSPEEIARAWDDLWSEAYTSEWPAVKARLYYVTEWCDQTFRWDGKSVLDIGAGEGTFMAFIRERGAYPIGIEPSRDNVLKIRASDMACHHGTLESIMPRQVDVVTILWTLENCGDCIDMLRRARACLGDGGRIVVATGSRILVPYKKPLGTYFSDNPADLHCFRWSANTLARALRMSGFGALMFNDYEQSDVLVVTASTNGGSDDLPGDDPAEVEKFFDDWARDWP